MSPKSIVGKYKLQSVAKAAPGTGADVTLEIEEEDGQLSFFAHVANNMRGSVTFNDGILKGMLMSTRMMGPEAEMQVEAALGQLADGVPARRAGDELIISTQPELVFVQTH